MTCWFFYIVQWIKPPSLNFQTLHLTNIWNRMFTNNTLPENPFFLCQNPFSSDSFLLLFNLFWIHNCLISLCAFHIYRTLMADVLNYVKYHWKSTLIFLSISCNFIYRIFFWCRISNHILKLLYASQNIVLTFSLSVTWTSAFRLTTEIRVMLFR